MRISDWSSDVCSSDLRRVLRRVELAVLDAVAGAHPLQLARAKHAFATVVVAMRQPAFEHVADDLHVGVAVRREAGARRDAILVDHPQRAPAHPRRVVVVAERERVVAVEPAGFYVAAVGGGAQDLHRGSSRKTWGGKARKSG